MSGISRSKTYFGIGFAAVLALAASPAIAAPEVGEEPEVDGPCQPAQFRADYFDNTDLEGKPYLIRCHDSIDFDWAFGRAEPLVPEDYFSVRWTGKVVVAPGTYRITATSDDGMRVYVDETLVLDAWRPRATAASVAIGVLAGGEHDVVVEYFEASGYAMAQVQAELSPTGWFQLPDVPVTLTGAIEPGGGS